MSDDIKDFVRQADIEPAYGRDEEKKTPSGPKVREQPYQLVVIRTQDFDRIGPIVLKLAHYGYPCKITPNPQRGTVSILVFVRDDDDYNAIRRQLSIEVYGFATL